MKDGRVKANKAIRNKGGWHVRSDKHVQDSNKANDVSYEDTVKKFVADFYNKHRRVMTKLAYE